MVPVVVSLMFIGTQKWDFIAAILFGIASITDFIDGYLARKQNLVTVYGKLMDPLADKFLIVSSLVMLQHLDRVHPTIIIILICRELAITGLRALASAEGVIIAASASAKWKTVTQMIAIPLIIAKEDLYGIPIYPIGKGLLYISLGISVWSAKSYIIDFFVALKAKRATRLLKKQEKIERRKKRKNKQ